MGDLDCSHCRIPAQGRVATPRQFERHNLLSATGLATCHPACIPCSNSTRGLHVCRRHSVHDRSWIPDQRQEGQVPARLLASLGNVCRRMPLPGNPLVRGPGLLKSRQEIQDKYLRSQREPRSPQRQKPTAARGTASRADHGSRLQRPRGQFGSKRDTGWWHFSLSCTDSWPAASRFTRQALCSRQLDWVAPLDHAF